MNGKIRADIKDGLKVKVITKQNQESGILTEGFVQDILTKSLTHQRGIKVRLTNGCIGRVQEILTEP